MKKKSAIAILVLGVTVMGATTMHAAVTDSTNFSQ
jgi:hypothetical protein